MLRPQKQHGQQDKRQLLLRIVRAELGVRERTGNNDGLRVEEYLRYTYLNRGSPWCASFVCWSLGQAGIKNPRSGYSPSLFPARHTVWQQNKITKGTPSKGDVFGLYFPEKGRIAHAGFIDSIDEKIIISVEGNTNMAGSREGDGVYQKRRWLSTIYKISRWE